MFALFLFPVPVQAGFPLSLVASSFNAVPTRTEEKLAMLSALFDNPVITKELRGRMRGTRTYWLLFSYVLVLSLILFFSYLGWWAQHSTDLINGGGSEAGFTVGRLFFRILFYSQAVMIALITPALTAGAISVEREQRTFELLRGSVLRPGAIVWGKLASSVSFVVLLLTSSLPLLSLCFLLGGVSPDEVFFAYLLLIGDAFLFGAIGLCWSAFAANTATATVLTYLTLFFFFGVTFPFAIPTFDTNGNMPNFGLCAVNPIGAVTGAVVPEHYYGFTLPAWIPALLINGTLTLLLVLAAMNRLEDVPAKRAAWLRLVTLLFAGLLVFFGDGLIAGIPSGIGVSVMLQVEIQLFFAAALLILFVPVLVTGELGMGMGKKRWSPLHVFSRATLPHGLPLALLLTALVLGITVAAVRFGLPMQTPGFRPGFAMATPFIVPSALTGTAVQQAAVLLVAVVVGISGVGFLLSVLLQNRWSALTLLYLALLLAVLLPFFTYGTLHGEDAAMAARNPAVNTLYLCPFIPLWQLSDELGPHPAYGPSSFGEDSAISGMFGSGSGPLWVGTGLVYLTIGLASYVSALAIVKRRRAMRSA